MMRNNTQLIIGAAILVLGLVLLVGNFIGINVGALFWPTLFIVAGLWLVLRQRMVEPGTAVTQKLIGDINRSGAWELSDEDFTLLIGDVNLDLRQAIIPKGVTHLRFSGFVNDINLVVPPEIGVTVSVSGFVSEVKLRGRKEESFLSSSRLQSENVASAIRHVEIHFTGFVGEVNVQ